MKIEDSSSKRKGVFSYFVPHNCDHSSIPQKLKTHRRRTKQRNFKAERERQIRGPQGSLRQRLRDGDGRPAREGHVRLPDQADGAQRDGRQAEEDEVRLQGAHQAVRQVGERPQSPPVRRSDRR